MTIKHLIKNPLILFLLFAILLYANTFKNDYSIDDNFVIYNNPQIEKGYSGIADIFTSRYYTEEGNTFGYRPLTRASFALEYSIWGANPHYSHIINIIIYILLIFVLYQTLLLITPPDNVRRIFIPLVLLFFIAHPLHTEVVASLKNREELFSALFSFIAMFLFLRFMNKKKWYTLILCTFSFILACLSKESSSVFALIIPFTYLFFNKKQGFWSPKNWIIPLITLIVLVGITLISVKIPETFLVKESKTALFIENPLHQAKDFSSVFAFSMASFLEYLKMFFIPFSLKFYYGYNMVNVSGPTDTYVLASLILFIATVAIFFMYLKKRSMIAYGIAFFFISISPFLNIFFPVNGIVAERFMFVPSLGIILAISHPLAKKINESQQGKKQIWMFLITFVLVIFSIRTFTRNQEWKNFDSIFESDIPKLSNSAKANAWYAGYLFTDEMKKLNNGIPVNSNQIQLAEKHYKASLSLYPQYHTALNNLGLIYLYFHHDPAGAIRFFTKAAQSYPNYTEAIYNTAYCYNQINNRDSAAFYYQMLLAIDSTNIQALSALSNLEFADGNYSEAFRLNQKIMDTDSLSDVAYIDAGNFYLQQSDTAMAVTFWEKAVSRNKNNPNLIYGLYRYFNQIGNNTKALYYQQLLQQTQDRKK